MPACLTSKRGTTYERHDLTMRGELKQPDNGHLKCEISPEIGLLLSIARALREPGERATAMTRLQAGIDWTRFLVLAGRHRLKPVVWEAIKNWDSSLLPEAVRQDLTRRHRNIALRNLCLSSELMKILARLQELGIEAAPFKGPVMTQLLYGQLALREFIDLDLLVPRSRILALRRILHQDGFDSPAVQNGRYEARHLRAQLGFDFNHRERGVVLEVHWNLIQSWLSFDLSPAEIWRDLQEVSLGGHRVRTLSHPHLLLYLCAHGAKHQWYGLFWILDVAELVRVAGQTMDWDRVLRMSTKAHSRTKLLLGLRLAAELFDSPVPKEVLALADQNAIVPALHDEVVRSLDETEGAVVDEDQFYLQVADHWTDRARYKLHQGTLAFRPTEDDFSWIDLPQSLDWAYPGVRLARLSLAAGRRLFGKAPD